MLPPSRGHNRRLCGNVESQFVNPNRITSGLVNLATASGAHAQLGRAVCPTCPGSIASVDSPGNAGRAQRDPRQGGCTAARLVGSTRPSGARLGQPSDRTRVALAIALTTAMGRTSTAFRAALRPQPRWSATGPGRRGDTMFAAIPASVSAATTRRSYGARHEQWAAPSPPIGGERSGCATTIRQETS